MDSKNNIQKQGFSGDHNENANKMQNITHETMFYYW